MNCEENEEDCGNTIHTAKNEKHQSDGKHTCIQCEYCDMWDMTCSNIDNADEDMNRITIYSDTPACQHFTPEVMER